MAQSAISPMPNGSTQGLTEEQRLELEEYEKIVHFRNIVFSGAHPHIKLPPHMAPQPLPTAKSSSTAPQPQINAPALAAPVAASTTTTNMERVTAGVIPQGDRQKGANKAVDSIPGIGKTNNPDINPIFLEKGPALIKAEMKLRREKIERALKEQVEQQRTAAKAAAQPGVEDEVPDFDVNEVLAKAIAIARAKPLVGEKKPAADAGSAPSDSFDDNTFYSSPVGSPEHSSSSRAHRVSGELSSRPILPSQPDTGVHSLAASANGFQSKQVANASMSSSVVPGLQELYRAQPRSAHILQDQQKSLPGKPPSGPSQRQQQNESSRENFYNNDIRKDQGGLPSNPQQGASSSVKTSFTGGQSARQDNTLPTHMEIDPAPTVQEPVSQGTKSPANAILPRPLSVEEPEDIHNFNLSPVAPQPVRVSPLATAKAPPFAQQNFELDGSQTYTPLQGRQDGSTTGNSSGQGKQAETQKGKRKLSSGKSGPRSNGAGASRPTSPYIKPEPRSPSPFNPAPLPRPHKRLRQTVQENGGLDYDEPRQEETRPPIQSKNLRPRQGNSRRFPRQQRDGPDEIVEIDEPQQRRIISQDVHPVPPLPRAHVVPFSPYDQRAERVALPVPRMVIDPYAPSSTYQTTPAPRSARPIEVIRNGSISPAFQQINSPVMMAPPPRMAERRLVMDEYGRQYFASIPVVPRQSMVQQSRVVDQDYIFDRPPRTMGRPVQHVYEDDGMLYKREQAYVPQRRVISMQDDQVESPSYRQREFSLRPLPLRQSEEQDEGEPVQVTGPKELSRRPSVARVPVDEYVRVGGDGYVRVMPPQRREMSHFEQQPQIVRIGSVRPEQRYGAPVREYVTSRAPSIHPDVQTPVRREFAPSVHPEERDEENIVRTREYSVRPADGMGPPRREYQQPVDAYRQHISRVLRRGDEDVEYVSYQQPMRQVTRRPEEDVRYAPRRELLQEEFDAQPQYQPRRQMQQEVYEDEEPQQVVYR